MTALSDALHDFYERKGGRIFFQNGMSLNQLALEMWERLGYQEIDPSVVSRVLKGERLFTPKQLNTFSEILHVPNHKRKLLSKFLINDISFRFGITLDEEEVNSRSFSSRTEDILNNSLVTIENLRLNGMSKIVQNLTDIMIEFSESIKPDISFSKVEKYQILKTQGLLLYEQIHSFTDTCLGSELITKIRTPLQRLTTIANRLKDNDLESRLRLLKTTSYGILGSYNPKCKNFHQIAKSISEEGLKMANEPTIELKLAGRLIESAGYLKEKNFIQYEGEHKILSLLESKGNQYPAQACILLSNLALAKSYIIMGKSAFSLIQRAWKIYQKQVVNQPRLEAHLVRSTLEVMVNLKNKDLTFANQLIKRIEILSSLGFKRHQFFSHKYYNLLFHNYSQKSFFSP